MTDRQNIEPIVPEEPYEGIRIVAMSDVGKVREENQDFMGWFRVEGQQLLVVADGMGGHSGGFEASRIAVDILRETFVTGAGSATPDQILRAGIQQANTQIRQIAEANPEMQGMGTTIVATLVSQGRAWVAHVGDSRAVLVRGGQVIQLTADHSRVNRMVQEGLIPPEAAEDHPMGHILERSVGAADEVNVEVRAEPVELCVGDRMVLSTDGFWGLVPGPEIAEVFADPSLRVAVERGIGLALQRGADDNTTIGSLQVVEGADPATAGPVTDAAAALMASAPLSEPGPAEPESTTRTQPMPSIRPEDLGPESGPTSGAGGNRTLLIIGLLGAVLLLLVGAVLAAVALRDDGGDRQRQGRSLETEDEATPERRTPAKDPEDRKKARRDRRERDGDRDRDETGDETRDETEEDREESDDPESTPEPSTGYDWEAEEDEPPTESRQGTREEMIERARLRCRPTESIGKCRTRVAERNRLGCRELEPLGACRRRKANEREREERDNTRDDSDTGDDDDDG